MKELIGLKHSMTSLEIAGLTGKKHKHVIRDIEIMVNELSGNETSPNLGRSKVGLPYKQRKGMLISLYVDKINGLSYEEGNIDSMIDFKQTIHGYDRGSNSTEIKELLALATTNVINSILRYSEKVEQARESAAMQLSINDVVRLFDDISVETATDLINKIKEGKISNITIKL